MPKPAFIFKLFTKEAILNSVPGLMRRVRRAPPATPLPGPIEIPKIEPVKKETMEVGGFEPAVEQKGVVKARKPRTVARPKLETTKQPAAGELPKPPTFQKIADIDFGNLTPLIQNPAVNMVECPGPGKNVIIRTYNQRTPSQVKLSAEEMMDLVTQFSKKARVPLINGLFRAWVDKFLVSSIIAKGQPINFIVQKVIYPHFS